MWRTRGRSSACARRGSRMQPRGSRALTGWLHMSSRFQSRRTGSHTSGSGPTSAGERSAATARITHALCTCTSTCTCTCACHDAPAVVAGAPQKSTRTSAVSRTPSDTRSRSAMWLWSRRPVNRPSRRRVKMRCRPSATSGNHSTGRHGCDRCTASRGCGLPRASLRLASCVTSARASRQFGALPTLVASGSRSAAGGSGPFVGTEHHSCVHPRSFRG